MKKAVAVISIVVLVGVALYMGFRKTPSDTAGKGTGSGSNNSGEAVGQAPIPEGLNEQVSATVKGQSSGSETVTTQVEGQTTVTYEQSPTVNYTATGFSPSTLTIKAGTAVTFLNQTSASMWVASNDHPAHLIYPEFDAKKGYAPGTSYTFTFTRTGTWGYHDHLNARNGGTIVVVQ